MDGRDAAAAQRPRALIEAAARAAPPLRSLEGSWMGMSGNSAAFAYAWSLAVVESMIDAGGVSDIGRLLDRIAASSSSEAAVRETLHTDYAGPQAADRRLPQARLLPLTLRVTRQNAKSTAHSWSFAGLRQQVHSVARSSPASSARALRERADRRRVSSGLCAPSADGSESIERRHAERRREISV